MQIVSVPKKSFALATRVKTAWIAHPLDSGPAKPVACQEQDSCKGGQDKLSETRVSAQLRMRTDLDLAARTC